MFDITDFRCCKPWADTDFEIKSLVISYYLSHNNSSLTRMDRKQDSKIDSRK